MLYRFALPDLGEGIAEGEVIEWLVQPGERVAADQPIAEVSTDKVDVVIPSPVAGVVETLRVEAGQTVPVGTVLAEILVEGATGGEVGAAAAVEQLAARMGVDLGTHRPGGVGVIHNPGSARRRGREAIARRLTEAAAVPVVTAFDEADFEAVLAVGRAPLAATARAAVLALGEHPQLNAWGSETGAVTKHEHVHLGIATQTAHGLVVPVVRDADRMSADELERAVKEATSAARDGRALPVDLRGSTFTITSAGRISSLFATPLLNPPEVATLGLYRIEQRPVVRDGTVVARRTAQVSVTFDHRALDGVAAARFLARVIELLESWPAD